MEPTPQILVSWKHWDKLHEFSPEIRKRMWSTLDEAKRLGIRLELERTSSRDDQQTEDGSAQWRSRVVVNRDEFSGLEAYKEISFWLEGVCFRLSRESLNMFNQLRDCQQLQELLCIAPQQLKQCGEPKRSSSLEIEYEYECRIMLRD